MANDNKDNENIQEAVSEPVENNIPEFEIGVKGDEFDRMYTRAAREKTKDADNLLKDLSRESKADKFNFLDALLPMMLICFAAITFAIVSRGDTEELFEVPFNKETFFDGSYITQLDAIYNDTLPFGDQIAYIGSFFGFGQQEKPALDDEPDTLPEEPIVPEVTEPVTTEPVVTTTTPATTEPTTVPTTETTPEVIETYPLYATATVNIRLGPGTDSAILGYFVVNDIVDVISIDENGWAQIYYNGMKAYVYSEYLGEEPVEITTETEEEEPEETVLTDEEEEIVSEETSIDDSGESSDETAASDDEQEESEEIIEENGEDFFGAGEETE